MEAVVDQVGHLGVRNLTDQISPTGIVHLGHNQIAGSQVSCNAHGGNCSHIRIILLLHLFYDGNTAAFLMGQTVGPHGLSDLQRCSGGPGAFPVVTGKISNSLAVSAFIEVQVRIIKQVGNGLAGCGGNGIGGGVHLSQSPLSSQGCITGAAHTGSVCTLGHQNVIDGVMSITANGEVVVTSVHNVGLGLHVIIGGQIFLINSDGEMLRRAGSDHLLVEAADLNSSLLHLIVDVILGIGRLEVDLHGMLTVHIAHILHIHIDFNGGTLVLNGKVGVFKLGVAQAISEGEGNIVIVLIIACVSTVQNIVFIPGLEIAVAHIDAFRIDQEIGVTLADAGVGIILCGSSIVVSSIGILVSAEVLHSGSRVVVLQEGIHDPAGGVDITNQNVCHSIDTGHANITDP